MHKKTSLEGSREREGLRVMVQGRTKAEVVACSVLHNCLTIDNN